MRKYGFLFAAFLMAFSGCAARKTPITGIDTSYIEKLPIASEPWLIKGTPENGSIYGKPDANGNGVKDDIEPQLTALVNRFCPTLMLDIDDSGGVLSRPLLPMPVDMFAKKLMVDCFRVSPFAWQRREIIDLSEIDDETLDLISPYFQINRAIQPGGMIRIPFLDFPGDSLNEWLWALNVIQWMDWYKPTTYAHPFIYSDSEGRKIVVIQYWYLFPFDGWYERHEGDWEHVNVVVTGLDPDAAQLLEVQFYFNGHFTATSEPKLENGDHVVIHVGGGATGSHGLYPRPGKWFFDDGRGERVNGKFRVGYRDFQVIIVPDVESVDLKDIPVDRRTEIGWLKLNVRWGKPWTDNSMSAVVSPLTDSGGYSPISPPFTPAWNSTGDCLGFKPYVPRERKWFDVLPTTDIIPYLFSGMKVYENALSGETGKR